MKKSNLKILALIPARGGSKRIPKKNILSLEGKPLIAYTICAAKKSKYINRIIVSTDSRQIAKVAKKYGAEVPFMRPREISQSHSTEQELFLHALDSLLKNEKYVPDLIVFLFPTAPFRKSESIDKAISEMLKHPEADSLRSIRICSEHPYKMWVEDGKYIKPFVSGKDSNAHTLSYQVLPRVYIQNANIYITKPSTVREKKSPVGDVIVPFLMDELESVDINTLLDFKYAEMLLNKKIVKIKK